MDLGLHLRVLWRFRFLLVIGLLFALMLTTLSVFHVSFEGGKPKLTYRQAEEYLSVSRLQITQAGFPEGRSVFPLIDPTKPDPTVQFADPSRFIQLAIFYSQLANSDEVQAMIYKEGRLAGSVLAEPEPDPTNPGAVLPFVDFAGHAADPVTAREAAIRGTKAFIRYLAERQRAAHIPESQRVLVKSVNQPQLGSLVAPRRKTRSIAIFLAVMIATIGLAFILENLRPRARAVTVVDDPDERSASRRIA